jgi:hypothetical protein
MSVFGAVLSEMWRLFSSLDFFQNYSKKNCKLVWRSGSGCVAVAGWQ